MAGLMTATTWYLMNAILEADENRRSITADEALVRGTQMSGKAHLARIGTVTGEVMPKLLKDGLVELEGGEGKLARYRMAVRGVAALKDHQDELARMSAESRLLVPQKVLETVPGQRAPAAPSKRKIIMSEVQQQAWFQEMQEMIAWQLKTEGLKDVSEIKGLPKFGREFFLDKIARGERIVTGKLYGTPDVVTGVGQPWTQEDEDYWAEKLGGKRKEIDSEEAVRVVAPRVYEEPIP